jgi:hypothetical protein
VQTGFTTGAGDYYIYAAPYFYEKFDYRLDGKGSFSRGAGKWNGDLSVGAGIGFGSMESIAALEISANVNGFRRFTQGSRLDAKVGRYIFNGKSLKIGLSAGSINAASIGKTAAEPSYYVAGSAAFPVMFEGNQRTVLINAGGGNGRYIETGSANLLEQGFFGSIGMEVASGVGLSIGVARGEGNATVSFAPNTRQPVKLNITAANIFDDDQGGRSVSIGFTWGGRLGVPEF